MKNVYCCVNWKPVELEKLSGSTTYQVMEKLNNGEKLTRNEKDYFLFECGAYSKILGWCFDFRPYCKRYLIHNSCGWYEYWHFDKTALKKHHTGIIEIVEIPKRA